VTDDTDSELESIVEGSPRAESGPWTILVSSDGTVPIGAHHGPQVSVLLVSTNAKASDLTAVAGSLAGAGLKEATGEDVLRTTQRVVRQAVDASAQSAVKIEAGFVFFNGSDREAAGMAWAGEAFSVTCRDDESGLLLSSCVTGTQGLEQFGKDSRMVTLSWPVGDARPVRERVLVIAQDLKPRVSVHEMAKGLGCPVDVVRDLMAKLEIPLGDENAMIPKAGMCELAAYWNEKRPIAPFNKVLTSSGEIVLPDGARSREGARRLPYAVIDGTNVCCWGRGMSLRPLLALVALLAEERREFICFFDANTKHRLPRNEAVVYQTMLFERHRSFAEVPGKTKADDFILRRAENLKGVVFTNDQYREHKEKYPWVEKDPERLIKGMVAGDRLMIAGLDVDLPLEPNAVIGWERVRRRL
jgi:hypothetical protein